MTTAGGIAAGGRVGRDGRQGALLLLPTLIAGSAPEHTLPAHTIDAARATRRFLAENARSTRAFLKAIGHPMPIASLDVVEVGHVPDPARFDEWLQPIVDGHDVALLSEAGCPAIADPGAGIVARAHERGLWVRPLVGPSSLLLGLMASGMSGQRFRFVGYLPQDRGALSAALGELERASRDGETQLFIETPYRNERLLQAVLDHCRPDTRLCVAVDLTGDGEQIVSLPVALWRTRPPGSRPALERRPALFALCAAQPAARTSARGRTTSSGRQ